MPQNQFRLFRIADADQQATATLVTETAIQLGDLEVGGFTTVKLALLKFC